MKKSRCDGGGSGSGGDDHEALSPLCAKKAKVLSDPDCDLLRRSQSLGSLNDIPDSLCDEDTKDGFDEMFPQNPPAVTTAVSDSITPLVLPHPLVSPPKSKSSRSPVAKSTPSEYIISPRRAGDSNGSLGSEPQTPVIDGTDPIEQLRELCGAVVGSAELCGKRPQMEDAHAIVPSLAAYMDEKSQDTETDAINYSAFCVLDGHAGDRVSQYVVKYLPLRLKAEIGKFEPKKDVQKCENDGNRNDGDDHGDNNKHEKAVVNALLNAYKIVDDEVTELAKSATFKWKDGSTSITVLMENTDMLYIANLGDCRAVLASSSNENEKITSTTTSSPQHPQMLSSLRTAQSVVEKEDEEASSLNTKGSENAKLCAIALSNDHHPSIQEEADRIKKCGGYVSAGRLMGIIEVSRAFGDLRFRNSGLISVPEITTHKIDKKNDKFMIIATDGIWKVISNEMAVDLVGEWLEKETDVQSVAVKLIHKAYSMGSTDNATVIIVVFPPPSS